MDGKFFEEGQLLDLKKDENDHEGNAEDMELAGIDVSKWDILNGLCVVPEQPRLEGHRQHNDSQVAGHWVRHRNQELVSRNFTCDCVSGWCGKCLVKENYFLMK